MRQTLPAGRTAAALNDQTGSSPHRSWTSHLKAVWYFVLLLALRLQLHTVQNSLDRKLTDPRRRRQARQRRLWSGTGSLHYGGWSKRGETFRHPPCNTTRLGADPSSILDNPQWPTSDCLLHQHFAPSTKRILLRAAAGEHLLNKRLQ